MVVIDTKDQVAHECVSKSEAARIVGVDRSTIHRWEKAGLVQVYNFYTIYFNTFRHKQAKGNNIPDSFRPRGYRRQ